LLPQIDDDGAVTEYIPVTAPWASIPPDAMFTFDDAGDQPRLVMSVRGDRGEENVIYVFEPIE
jgi:hypothetical protein